MRSLLTIFLLIVTLVSNATHLRSADIRVETMCNTPLTFRITIIAYLNTQSPTRFGTNSQVYFGDGTFVQIPLTTATFRPDLGINIAVATFTTTHTYPAYGNYTIGYIERDRSAGILNIANSTDVPYVTFVNLTIDQKYACNSVPILTVPPLDRACFKSAFFHTSGAYDPDGDSLSYELSIPAGSLTTSANYTAPNHSRFYTNFNQGNESANGPPVFSIDAVSGLLTWDAPGTLGEYNIAFKIVEWRKDSLTNTYKKLSTTTRDMQILVEECQNIRPSLTVPNDICVIAGTSLSEIIQGMDGDNHAVKIEVFSELIDLPAGKSPATYSPSPPEFIASVPAAELQFNWQTTCDHVRQQPYQVVFKITDNPPQGPKLVNFKIWTIKVVAPAPVWNNTQLDLTKRFATIAWDTYSCTNASKIQVWRKVDSYPFAASDCAPGIPNYLGYNLIAQVDPTVTQYIDTNFGRGLFAGATYCYRILAYFNAPASTPSLVSTEVCIGPIETDAPVITHVSIDKTDSLQGQVQVSWRTPFAINETQFPKPYEYEVYRAYGFFGDAELVKAGRVSDTTFRDTAIDTEHDVFNYRIVLYSKPLNGTDMVPVDTSAVASSERLAFSAGEKQIELMWRDSVPWSNVVQQKPYHLIYRGVEDPDPATMTLIDSVNVTENGFYYLDKGQYNNVALEDGKRYSYRILTRGTYGNSNIALQENFSQVITTYPQSDLIPCDQELEIAIVNCDQYLNENNCTQTEFSNSLSWTIKDLPDCRRDIVSYNIYTSTDPEGEFTFLTSVRSTSFVHTGLSSFAGCYKISAVDALGQEGPLSELVCNDNCPYYLLPNVFTPNEDGFNDTFSANFDVEAEEGQGVTIRCPRFVDQVIFFVYNRWGNEVYKYTSSESGNTSIEWNGKDDNGHELTEGVYYYRAEVTFNRLYPSDRFKVINGWVHLVK